MTAKGVRMNLFSRPCGTYVIWRTNPALKCRVIFRCPFGTGTSKSILYAENVARSGAFDYPELALLRPPSPRPSPPGEGEAAGRAKYLSDIPANTDMDFNYDC